MFLAASSDDHAGPVEALMASRDWGAGGGPAGWEPALRHALRQMLDAAVPMFIVCAGSETFLYNDAYVPMLGRRHPAALGQPFSVVWPEAYAAVAPAVAQAMAGRPVRFDDAPFTLTRNGVAERAWFSFTYSPLRSLDGRVLGLACTVAETTGQVREAQRQRRDQARTRALMEALGKSEARFRTMADAMPQLQFALAAGTPDWFNQRFLDFTGRTAAELAGDGWLRLVHPDDAAAVRMAWHGARTAEGEGAQAFDAEFRLRHRDGAYRWILARALPVSGNDGRPPQWLGSFTDIDAQKHGEAALRDARLRLEGALAAAEIGTWTWNMRENRVYADANLARLYGVSAADAGGGAIEAYLAAIHPDDVAQVQARIAQALATGEAFSDNYRVRRADGGYRHVEARGKVAFGSDGRPEWLPGVALDVSARKEAEEALLRSETRFRVIANAMPQAVWSTRPDGFHDYYNDQWYAFTGMPYGATDGDGWNDLFHPDDQPRAWDKWRHSLRTGEPYDIEYRLRHHSGSYRWVLGRALPVRAEDGSIVRWMGTCTDIHEQKLAREALQEADRRKDEFLAMLAHELRNPLAPIATAAALLSMAAQDPARVRQVGAVISRQAAHMTGLIDDLMDVSRVTRGLVTLEKQIVALSDVIDDAVEQVRPLIEGRAHRLEIRSRAAGVHVDGDRKRLVQVLANILGNAARYTPAGGHIVLSAGTEAGRAVLAVRDNGIGMPPELVASAFELFYQGRRSSDRSQGGLGIGLALVRSLVQLHGGQVSAASEGEGRGSTFTVTLPLPAGAAHTPGPEADAPPHAAPVALRVLVVDDNTDAAELVAMFLQLLGYEVSVEFGAAAALERARKVMPHVCLLDIGLPGMDGMELARRLRRLPGLERVRLAAMTGYGQPHDRSQSEAAGFDAHFVKPVETDALAAWLAQTLS